MRECCFQGLSVHANRAVTLAVQHNAGQTTACPDWSTLRSGNRKTTAREYVPRTSLIRCSVVGIQGGAAAASGGAVTAHPPSSPSEHSIIRPLCLLVTSYCL